MRIVRGPDFPTGGIILGRKGIRDAFTTGRGKIIVRAKVTVESSSAGKDSIIITEIPYQVNKSNLIVRIADLVKEKKIDGIVDLNDESDSHGMRIVIDLRKGVSPKVILNQLFAHTQMQIAFGVINLALVKGLPKTLSLKEILQHFIAHRKEVVTRRTRYDLAKAEERAHILQGLRIALENIDEVIAIIKKSEDAATARTSLMSTFSLSERQAQAILDMRLQRLTSLEVQKVIDELAEVLALIETLKALLASEQKIYGVVKEETEDISKRFGDDRRTEIIEEEAEEINVEDLIAEEDMVVLISNRGYIKRIPVTAYRRQGRGGKGSSSALLKEDDFIEQFFVASTHDFVLFITNQGKAYWVKVHEIPESSRQAKGQSIKVLLSLGSEEEITAVVNLRNFTDKMFVLMATRQGVVKKVAISEFANAKTRGIVAIKLDQGDGLVTALLTSGSDEVVLVTRKGIALRFHEEAVRAMGRASHGVQGIKLSEKDELTGVAMVRQGEQMLLVSEFGFGKRTAYDNFSPHGRGTRGQICYKATEKTGEVVGVLSVSDKDDLVCITSQGNTLKLRLSEVATSGKTAMGVRIVNITAAGRRGGNRARWSRKKRTGGSEGSSSLDRLVPQFRRRSRHPHHQRDAWNGRSSSRSALPRTIHGNSSFHRDDTDRRAGAANLRLHLESSSCLVCTATSLGGDACLAEAALAQKIRKLSSRSFYGYTDLLFHRQVARETSACLVMTGQEMPSRFSMLVLVYLLVVILLSF